LKEKEKLAKLLLFYEDSQMLVTVDNQHKTDSKSFSQVHKVAANSTNKHSTAGLPLHPAHD